MTTLQQQQQTPAEPLKLVPFNDAWITHDKLDLKAIYQRPRYREDEYGDQLRELDDQGNPTWDLTAPLPIKQHNRWRSKGFVYVTLADMESLVIAGTKGTIVDPSSGEQLDWHQFKQHARSGPWNYKRWLVGQDVKRSRDDADLAEDVKDFGSDVVFRLRSRENPNFRLPVHLQGLAAKATAEIPPARKRSDGPA